MNTNARREGILSVGDVDPKVVTVRGGDVKIEGVAASVHGEEDLEGSQLLSRSSGAHALLYELPEGLALLGRLLSLHCELWTQFFLLALSGGLAELKRAARSFPFSFSCMYAPAAAPPRHFSCRRLVALRF